MKKYLILSIAVLLFACSSDDAVTTESEVTLFVNHFKTTSYLYPTALQVQEGETIGSDDFQRIAGISGFEFEPGFTYTLQAKKIRTEQAGTDASTVAYELISVTDQQPVAPETTFEVPLTTYINGIGYVNYLVGDADNGYFIASRIGIDCHQLCDEIESRIRLDDIVIGTFIHGPEGTYDLISLN